MKILFDMDKKVIKINEAKIREMVAKSLREEYINRGEPKGLKDELYNILHDLHTFAESVSHTYKGFEETEDGEDLSFIIDRLDDLYGWVCKNKNTNFELGDSYCSHGYSKKMPFFGSTYGTLDDED